MTCRECGARLLPGDARCAACACRKAQNNAQRAAWQKAHPAAHRAHALAYQARNKAAGRCEKCGRPAIPRRTHCLACAEKARASAAAYRERNRAAGLCAKCGDPALPERTLCARCSERQRSFDRARVRRRAVA